MTSKVAPVLALPLEQQVDDRGAGRGVEIAGRLVGEDAVPGRGAVARAMATRCCSPPESCAG